jgi:hypothetical protein
MPGEASTEKPHLLEILGDHGNMMVEGIHPTGDRYHYRDGKDLIAWGAENLAEVDVQRVSDFLAAAIGLTMERGGVIASHTSAGSHDDSDRLPIRRI